MSPGNPEKLPGVLFGEMIKRTPPIVTYGSDYRVSLNSSAGRHGFLIFMNKIQEFMIGMQIDRNANHQEDCRMLKLSWDDNGNMTEKPEFLH